MMPLTASQGFGTLAPDARVWIYQLNRAVNAAEESALRAQLAAFAEQWTSHQQALRAHADVLYQRFIVLMADESAAAGASGCAIDASVRFIRQLEQQFGFQAFDRTTVAYLEGEQVHTVPLSQLKAWAAEYRAAEKPLPPVFNNLVATQRAFVEQWLTPIAESWHQRFV